MNTKDVTRYSKEIHSAAQTVAFKWPGLIAVDEAEQEIYMHLLAHPRAIDRLSPMTPGVRRRALAKIGHTVAAQWRDSHALFSGNVFYSVDDVEQLLDDGLLLAVQDEAGPGSETQIEYLDLQESIRALFREDSKNYARLINKYINGIEARHPAYLNQALEALTNRMNRVHRKRRAEYDDGPGSRRVMSNSAARVKTVTNWQGDLLEGQR